MTKTYAETFGKRVEKGLSQEEIRRRFELMVDDLYNDAIADHKVAAQVLTAARKLGLEEYDPPSYEDFIRHACTLLTGSNLGYWLGYHSDQTMKEWFEALPDVSHPVFGRDYQPTAVEALSAGMKMAHVPEEGGEASAGAEK